MEEEEGVHRWLVDISQWNPSEEEFFFILSLFPLHEHSAITRFIKFEDRKRAIISRLLQYALVHRVFEIPFDRIVIKRTVEGKPYLETEGSKLKRSNFNFNASHHGDYVAIASEPMYLVGVDIVSLDVPKQETALEFIKNFSLCLTSFEWDCIISAGTSDEILAEFYRYWCLKEAFIKAIGAGLGYRLDRLEFHHTNWKNISVHIDGDLLGEWRFYLFELQKNHWVSVAKGHPRTAVENYQRTLHLTEFEKEKCQLGNQPNGFVLCTVDELIPACFRVSYSKLTSNREYYGTKAGDMPERMSTS